MTRKNKSSKKEQSTFTREMGIELARQAVACESLIQVAELLEQAAKRIQRRHSRIKREERRRLEARRVKALEKGLVEKLEIRIAKTRQPSAWVSQLRQLALSLRMGKPAYEIIKLDGNIKLPFAAFSTLPLVTCPGAGACANYCYSLTAWRYPAAYLRQLQNTVLLRLAPEVVADAFFALPHGVDLRLYVDGDISDIQTMVFWFSLLKSRQDINAYGYSKSLALFAKYADLVDNIGAAWPSNYTLNLSNGSCDESADLIERILSLPITRGRFVAVKTDNKHSKDTEKRFSSADYHRDVRSAARREYSTSKVFSCPGRCGSCTARQHACGSRRFNDVVIAIGIH